MVYRGDIRRVKETIESTPSLCKRLASVTGLTGTHKFGQKEYHLYSWNPLLLAISKKNCQLLELLFDHPKTEPNFHILNALSKPYTQEDQK